MNRRTFLNQSVAVSTIAMGTLISAEAPIPAAPAAPTRSEPTRGSPFDVATVKEFVGAGHGNLARVKEMLAAEPKLVLASYDWGSGDFETALGGAAHTGRREMALHLLDAGARVDAFAAAMLGETELMTSILRFAPATASTRGPHGYSLLYHAGYSGKVPLAAAIVEQLKDPAPHCNQALLTATQRGHTELVAWLLSHGVTNPNVKNFSGKTSLDVAVELKHNDVAELLRTSGGLTTR
jgi:hypothetical protein